MKTKEIIFPILLIIAVILLFSGSFRSNIITGFASFDTAMASVNLSEESSIKTGGNINFGSGRVNTSASSATLDTYDLNNTGADIATSQNMSQPNWINTSSWTRYISIENDGTVNISITAKAEGNKNAAGFIGGSSPEFKIRGISTESSACPTLNTTYQNVPNSTETPITICNSLNFALLTDSFNVSTRLVVPNDAIAGQRNVTLTFSCSQV